MCPMHQLGKTLHKLAALFFRGRVREEAPETACTLLFVAVLCCEKRCVYSVNMFPVSTTLAVLSADQVQPKILHGQCDCFFLC